MRAIDSASIEPAAASITEPNTTSPELPIANCVTVNIDPITSATDPNVTLVASYGYDAFGNRTSTAVDDLDGTTPTRTTNVAYGELDGGTTITANGRFPVRVQRVLGALDTGNPPVPDTPQTPDHIAYAQYDGRFGTVIRSVDPNSVATSFTLDNFGRLTTEIRPDNSRTTVYHGWCADALPTCPDGGKLKGVTMTDGAPTTAAVMDILGRQITAATGAFDGRAIMTSSVFDNVGFLHTQSRPYFYGQTRYLMTLDHDTLGRVTRQTDPGETGSVITTFGFTGGPSGQSVYQEDVTITNPANQVSHHRYDVRGELVSTIDAASTPTAFTYDTFGNVVTTKVNGQANTQITNTYDIRGRKRKMVDPDLSPGTGNWQFTYFGFGNELKQQTSAKGQTMSLTYDGVGRVKTRVEPEGTTTLTYDTATKGIGQIQSVVGAEGETKTFGYDNFGRPLTTQTDISGAGSYQTRTDFDSFGRVNKITYPASTAYPSGLRVRYDYSAYGYMTAVSNDLVPSAPAYWTLNDHAADGQVLKATLGNTVTTEYTYVPQTGNIDSIRSRVGSSGPYSVENFEYDFNALGFLQERRDVNLKQREQLVNSDSYDALNRVKTVRRYDFTSGSDVLQETNTAAYDALGNITSKSQMVGTTSGTYNYTTAATCTGVTGAVNPGPHAVRRMTVGANTRNFCYDANGNQLRGWNFTRNRQRDMTWTSYNQPKTVTEASQSLTFSYGASRNRFKQVNAVTGQTTLYVDRIYEKQTVGTTTTHVHYVFVNGQAIAIYKSKSDSTEETLYPHRDHLGSVTQVTDANHNVVDTLSYDIWGKRRNANWTDASSQIFPVKGPRGYTGHEHLDDMSIIHMNARTYDPSLGRMLSPDPFVDFPGHSQSYNRFSYVLNNPLAYTDPSGFGFFQNVWGYVKDAASAVWHGVTSSFTSSFSCDSGCGGGMTGSSWFYGPGDSRGWSGGDSVALFYGSFQVDYGYHIPVWTQWDLLALESIDAGMTYPTFSVAPATSAIYYEGHIYDSQPPSSGVYGSVAANGQPSLGGAWGRPAAGTRSPALEQSGNPNTEASGMSWADKAHLALNGASIVLDASVFGSVFAWIPDVIDAGVSLGEGDFVGAGMSIIGAIPELGAAANAAKIARIAEKVAVDARKIEKTEEAAKEGIIYLRRDAKGGEYVGQAESPERYAQRQLEHANDHPTESFVFHELERVPPNSGRSLDVAEEDWIRAGGGPQSTGGGRLQNARHQMSAENYRDAGGTIPYP